MTLPDLSGLDKSPILQFLLGVPVAIVALLMWVKGQRDNKTLPVVAPAPIATQFFLDGPVEKVLESINRMSVALERAPADREEFLRWTKEFEDKFSEAKRRIYDEIDKRCNAEAAERRDTEKILREVELKLAELAGRIPDIRRR